MGGSIDLTKGLGADGGARAVAGVEGDLSRAGPRRVCRTTRRCKGRGPCVGYETRPVARRRRWIVLFPPLSSFSPCALSSSSVQRSGRGWFVQSPLVGRSRDGIYPVCTLRGPRQLVPFCGVLLLSKYSRFLVSHLIRGCY